VFAIMERVAVGVVTVLGVVVVAIGTKMRFKSRLLHIKNVRKCDVFTSLRLFRDFCVFMRSSSSILSSSILSSITLI
jgi:hypothetical protein